MTRVVRAILLPVALLAVTMLLALPSTASAIEVPVGGVFVVDGCTYRVLTPSMMLAGLPIAPTVQVGDGTNPATAPGDLSVVPATVANDGSVYRVTHIAEAAGGNATGAVFISEGVTSIGYRAFMYGGLTGVYLPDSVSQIGSQAFAFCGNLARVNIPDGVTVIREGTFTECRALTEIAIGAGVKEIEAPGTYWGGRRWGAFEGCTSLAQVTVPDNVEHIGAAAFENCTSLGTVTLGSGVKSIGGYTFTNWFAIAERAGAFGGCSALSDINLPEGLMSIGAGAFEQCGQLQSLSIPVGVTTIGSGAFSNCARLTDLILPDGLESLGDRAFSSCVGLTKVSIPASLTQIGAQAFDACLGLTRIDVDGRNQSFCSVQGVLFNKAKSLLIQYPIAREGSYAIPAGVTSIGDNAFASCASLTGVTIPEGVTSIGVRSFTNCTQLTSVIIPGTASSVGALAFSQSGLKTVSVQAGVASLGYGAFMYCGHLKSIVLPSSLTHVGAVAFLDCWSLTTVQFDSRTTVVDVDTWPPSPRTIPAQTKIRGYIASTAETFSRTWGNQFEAMDFDNVPSVPDNSKTKKPVLVFVAGLNSDTGHHAVPRDGWKWDEPDAFADGWAMNASETLGNPWGYVARMDVATRLLGAHDVLVMPTAPNSTWWPDEYGAGVLDSTGGLSGNMFKLATWLQSPEVVARTAGHPIIIIGHSYGGVIARSMLSSNQLALGSSVRDDIAGIIQFGSPNGGSPLASEVNWPVLEMVGGWAGVGKNAFTLDLAMGTMKEWNERYSGSVGVPVHRFGGTYAPWVIDLMPRDFGRGMLSHNSGVLETFESDGLGNDGLVAYRSLETGYGSLDSPDVDFGGGGCTPYPTLAHAADLPGAGKTYWAPTGFLQAEQFKFEALVPGNSEGLLLSILASRIRRIAEAAPQGPQASAQVRAASLATGAEPKPACFEIPALLVNVQADSASQISLPIDAETRFIASSANGTPTVTVRNASGMSVESAAWSSPGTDGNILTMFEITPANPGSHTIDVSLPPGVSGEVAISGVIGDGAQLSLPDCSARYAGEPATLTTQFSSAAGEPLLGAAVTATATLDGGSAVALTFHDDGTGGDSIPSDGSYAAEFTPPATGRWLVQLEGRHPSAQRTGLQVLDVGEHVAVVTGPITELLAPGPGTTFDSFGIAVPLHVSMEGTYTVSSVLTDEAGARVGILKATSSLESDESTTLVASIAGSRLAEISPGRLTVGPLVVTRHADGIELDAGAAPGLSTTQAFSATDFFNFSVQLTGPASNPSPTGDVHFAGRAVNTSSTVEAVEYSIDGGSTWSTVVASDGAFDSQAEDFSVDLNLPDQVYGILVRQTGSDGTILPVEDWAGARFTVDTVAPATLAEVTAYVSTDTGSPVAKVSWAPTDLPSSTVATVRYRIDVDGVESVVTYDTSAAVPLPDTNSHVIAVTPVDAAGNVGPARSINARVPVSDTTPPLSELDLLPAPNASGWCTGTPVVSFSATDGPEGYGAARVDYRLGSDAVRLYTGPFSLAGEGVHSIEHFATDVVGNREATKTATIRIDKTAPSTAIAAESSYASPARIILSADDSGLSGVARTEWRIAGAEDWTVGTAVSVSALGVHEIEYRSTDVAGNTERTRSHTFTVVAPAPPEAPAVAHPSTVTVTSRANSALAFGSAFTVAGVLQSGATGLTGQRVILQSAAPGAAFTDSLYTQTTGADGLFSFTVRPLTKTYYRVRFAGTTDHAAAVAGASVYARPRVSLTRSTSWSSLSRGRTYYARGFIRPRHTARDGNSVRIRAYKKASNGKYYFKQSFVASYSYYSSDKTRYRAAVRLASRGKWKLVAYHAPDARNAESLGSADYVTVE